MSTRCKFKCESKNNQTVVLNAVSATGDENKSWSQATPTGRLEMSITNPPALEQFTVGQEYYLDISKAP